MNFPKDKIVVAVSGGFDPLHIGHVRMFQEAKKLGDILVVFVNRDEFLTHKKGKPFMSCEDRMEIISEFDCVDVVVSTIDEDQSVCETLRKYSPSIFANGGDRWADNIPEKVVCDELGIQTVFNVGDGGKVRSSSDLLSDWVEFQIEK